MAAAEVGDDVLGDDPTVNALERRTAEVLGKEAAVYMPSGTMANQVAVRTHTQPGDEIVLDANAHVYFYEAGAPAAVCGVMTRLVTGRRCIFTGDDLRAVLRPTNIHFAPTRLVIVENTTNRGGGSVWPMATLTDVADAAGQAGLKLHMDGARIWNAAVALGIPEREIAERFDSVSVCFSKGLGAPVGSALAGSAEFVQRARRFRKMFGGGMRQAGIIAAGALYALDNHRRRLADDHANARNLARGIADLPGVEIDLDTVETNIVIFRVTTMPAAETVEKLAAAGVAVLATGPDTVRAVTNLMVSADDVTAAVGIFADVSGT